MLQALPVGWAASGLSTTLHRGSRAALAESLYMKEVNHWCVLVVADFGRVGAPQSVGLAQCPSKSFAGNNDVQGAAPPLTPATKPATLPGVSAVC